MKNKKIVSLLLCVVIAFISIFSFAFIMQEDEHCCTGESCEICQVIGICKLLNLSVIAVGITVVFRKRFPAVVYNLLGNKFCAFENLISLKVKLSN